MDVWEYDNIKFINTLHIKITLSLFQWVASIDLKANDQADANILVKHDENWVQQVCRNLML
jgi:hypothetical protein